MQFYGDKLQMREGGVLVISNHKDLSDWLMMLTIGLRQGRMGSSKFFIKEIVKYVPGNFFIFLFFYFFIFLFIFLFYLK